MYLGPCASGPYGFIGLVPIMYAPGPSHGSRAVVPGEYGDTGHPSRRGAAARCWAGAWPGPHGGRRAVSRGDEGQDPKALAAPLHSA